VEGIVLDTRPELGEIVIRQSIPGVGTIDRTLLLGERAGSMASRLQPGALVRLRLSGSSGQVTVQQLTRLRATSGGAGIPTTTIGPVERGRLVAGAAAGSGTSFRSTARSGRDGLNVTRTQTASGTAALSNDAIDRAIEAQLDLFDQQIESLRDARVGSSGQSPLAFHQNLQNLQASLQNLGTLVAMQQGGNRNLLGGTNATGTLSNDASFGNGMAAGGTLNATGQTGLLPSGAATDARSPQRSGMREPAGITGSASVDGTGLGAQGTTDARSPRSTNLRGQETTGRVSAGDARQMGLTAGRRDASNLRQSGTLSGRTQPANLPSFDERRLVETDFQQSLNSMEIQLDELSRASGRFTTAERVAFRQRIGNLQSELRNANRRLDTLQGRNGRAWLDARAELDALLADLAMQLQETGSLFGGNLR
jgi:hypothetical protein